MIMRPGLKELGAFPGRVKEPANNLLSHFKGQSLDGPSENVTIN